MSITDSSTNLDLAYTEQSVVAFTTGVLSGVDECVDEVESKLQRGTLSTSTKPTLAWVKNWLRRAKMELSEIKSFTFNRKYATATTSTGTYRYALPPDYNGGLTRIKDTTNNRYLAIWQTHWYDKKFPDPSQENNNEPTIACIKNMEMWLMPPPDGAYTIELEYDRSGAETTADDFAWLPEMERFRCCDFAIAEAFESIGDFQKANIYRAKWNQGLAKAIRADGMRKWKRSGFQAISVFQNRGKTLDEIVSGSGSGASTESGDSLLLE